MKCAAVICVLSVLFASACADAASRAARPLDVRSDGQNVVACLSLDEGETVAIDAAGVSPITVGGRTPAKPWGIVLGAGQRPHSLAPGDCLIYGGVPEGYTEFAPAIELESGWPYSFAIRSPEWGRFRTRNYSGVFCLRRTAAGILVANVPKGPAVITTDTCRQLLDAVAD